MGNISACYCSLVRTIHADVEVEEPGVEIGDWVGRSLERKGGGRRAMCWSERERLSQQLRKATTCTESYTYFFSRKHMIVSN